MSFCPLITTRFPNVGLEFRRILSKIVPDSCDPGPIRAPEGLCKLRRHFPDTSQMLIEGMLVPNMIGRLTYVSQCLREHIGSLKRIC